MAKKKTSNRAGNDKPDVKVQDLQPETNPKAGASPQLAPGKWFSEPNLSIKSKG